MPASMTTSSLLAGVLSLAVLAAPALAATCYANLPQSKFPNCTSVTDAFALHWSVSPSTGFITFGVDMDVPASQNQWIGVGLSDAGGMRGADMWILLKYPGNNSYYIQDSFSKDFITPVADVSQDIKLLQPPNPSSTTNTVYTFARALDTCDPTDRAIIQGTLSNIVWAHGNSSASISQHAPTDRGTFRVVLYDDPAQPAAPPLPSDAMSYSMRMNNVTVPPITGYLCTHFLFPASDKPYHIVQYEGLTGSKYVHHMLAYGCDVGFVPPTMDLFECSSMPDSCNNLLFIWAPGTPPFYFPEDVGARVGQNAYQYMALQVHYTNPSSDKNVVDNSGLTLRYTSQLRPHDMGVLWLGSQQINIPGNSPNPTVLKPNVCPMGCTSTFTSNLTLFATFPHMHTLGLNLTTRHIRNGVEMDPITTREYYDFNFQTTNPITSPSARTILPGDTLITTCSYIPTAGVRTSPTHYGLQTTDEMCYSFLFYYPAMTKVDHCMTIFNGLPGVAGVSTAGSDLSVCSTLELLDEAIVGAFKKEGIPPTKNGTYSFGNTTALQKLALLEDLAGSGGMNRLFTQFDPTAASTYKTLVDVCNATAQLNNYPTTSAGMPAISASVWFTAILAGLLAALA
ncbi:hypothetical protein HK101_009709 [Irineochytrium annulatum]|nr:hypothetical protein HK101_009709 [Irineochytrium annulatum]